MASAKDHWESSCVDRALKMGSHVETSRMIADCSSLVMQLEVCQR